MNLKNTNNAALSVLSNRLRSFFFIWLGLMISFPAFAAVPFITAEPTVQTDIYRRYGNLLGRCNRNGSAELSVVSRWLCFLK